jgi:hypothetical protein
MKLFYLILILAGAGLSCHAQSVTFDYDNSGNRISRSLTLKSAPGKSGETLSSDILENKPGDFNIYIFPNPVKNELNIKLENPDENAVTDLVLYNYQGEPILATKYVSPVTIINMASLIPGTYLLVISSGNDTVKWKIIKE